MLSNETASLQEVAEALGRDPDWLRRNWLKIHQRFGFPRKSALGWVWPRRLVEAFLASPQRASVQLHDAPANENEVAAVDPVAAARAAAAARYGGRA